MKSNSNESNLRTSLVQNHVDGMNRTKLAVVVLAVLSVFGIVFYSFSDRPATTPSSAIERSMPPATTGQGGAPSTMPAAKDTAQ
jgi:hypothetical protein